MDHERQQHAYVSRLFDRFSVGEDPYPRIVEIHPTDACNHRCDYCFHGGVGLDSSRRDETLPIARYRALFRELARIGIDQISIAGGGEPFLDPRLDRLLTDAHLCGHQVRVVTHGNHMPPTWVENILRCKEIRFSVDAASPAVYQHIRKIPGRMFHRTVSNISMLIDARRGTSSDLRIGVSFLLQAANVAELPAFCEFFSRLEVDSITVKHDVYGSSLAPDVADRLRRDLAPAYPKKLDFRSPAQFVPGACFTPYMMVVVDPYGDIFSCALGSQPGETSGFRLGSIRNRSFASLWAESQKTRESMRSAVHCQNCNHTDIGINEQLRALLDREAPLQ